MSEDEIEKGEETLRSAMRSVLDGHPEIVSPDLLADMIIRRQDPSERIAGYRYLLRTFGAKFMSNERAAASRTAPPSGTRVVGPSRVDAVRSWWARQLDQRVAVGESWKSMRDLTRHEVDQIAEARHKSAEETLAIALRFERLSAAMVACSAETLGDVPEDAAAEAWKTSEVAA